MGIENWWECASLVASRVVLRHGREWRKGCDSEDEGNCEGHHFGDNLNANFYAEVVIRVYINLCLLHTYDSNLILDKMRKWVRTYTKVIG